MVFWHRNGLLSVAAGVVAVGLSVLVGCGEPNMPERTCL